MKIIDQEDVTYRTDCKRPQLVSEQVAVKVRSSKGETQAVQVVATLHKLTPREVNEKKEFEEYWRKVESGEIVRLPFVFPPARRVVPTMFLHTPSTVAPMQPPTGFGRVRKLGR